jgi:hypothetical protein
MVFFSMVSFWLPFCSANNRKLAVPKRNFKMQNALSIKQSAHRLKAIFPELKIGHFLNALSRASGVKDWHTASKKPQALRYPPSESSLTASLLGLIDPSILNEHINEVLGAVYGDNRDREIIVLNDGFFLREPTKFDSMNRFQPLNALSEAIHDGDVRDESNITRVLSLSGLRLDQLIIDELALINLYMREGHKAKIRVNILTNAPELDTSRAWPSQLMDLLSKHLSIVYVYTPETDPKNVFDAIGLASVDTLSDFVIRRLHNGDVKCNVGHQVSWRSVDMSLLSDFEFGYIGTGPHELSINILYEMGVLHRDVCRRLTSVFTEEVLNYLPNEGGIIKRKDVLDWMLSKRQKVEQIWSSEF